MKTIIYYLNIIVLMSMFSGCSHFTFNATMCDKIASDPLSTIPQECRIYNEDEATKSFNNTQNKRMESNETIEFTNE